MTEANSSAWTAQILGRDLEIVRKDPNQRGFQVQPKRRAVERTFSWLTAHRRPARDYETSPAHPETMIRWAMIGVMARRLTRGPCCHAPRPPTARTAILVVILPTHRRRQDAVAGLPSVEPLDLAFQCRRHVGQL